MSQNRKAALIGIWVGGTASVVGFLPIIIATASFVFFGGPVHPAHVDHPVFIFVPMMAMFIAPIGLLFGIPGFIILVVSIAIYFDAKRKERADDLTNRSGQPMAAEKLS